MTQPGTSDNPLRVAIIGSGPSGFYAAEYLQKQNDLVVEIDMYDRLPTPFGLVRGGVAPDHLKIKSVTRVYDKIATKDNFRFFGNVEFGTHITRADLQQHYHAVIYSVGSSSDKKLDIPGEDLAGSWPATEFVGWYNGHPDYRHFEFDLENVKRVAIIGIGNVAMDVTRILARSEAELQDTDIADYALEKLMQSNVEEIYVFGRRGPAQAAFTNKEIKELGEMESADIVVSADEVDLDEHSLAYLEAADADKKDIKNVEILREFVGRGASGKPKKIIMRFLVSPIELIGEERVEAIKIVKNELYLNERGVIRPRATEKTETIPVDLVFRSVGYRGIPLPDVPFFDKWGTIPNEMGRVLTEHEIGEQVIGDYVSGWIKRGPSGIIGTNRPDSVETVTMLLEDIANGKHWQPDNPSGDAVLALIQARKPDFVDYAGWQILDQLEIERGEAIGRPRLKFTRIEEMLDALATARSGQLGGD